MRKKLMLLMAIASMVIIAINPCGPLSSSCYSQYEGCDATVEAIQTAAEH